ncbi:hypothetical protein [Limnobacter parvus]|uniref:Uncharacterized protein n=1 Tax=Limnobacter parvus TaxID=2939690 RepID=A0ABT1XK72_9BURK|nr:hypothetical protein [Limnobacter parvus]MCR2747702.1 hypothetical protein [Limnobacter parvus]
MTWSKATKKMSGFTNSIYNADRVGQSIALLGGATADAYSAVGLQSWHAHTEFTSQFIDPSPWTNIASTMRQNIEVITAPAPGLSAVSEPTTKLASNVAQFSSPDELANFLPATQQPSTFDAELLSRYESFESFLDSAPTQSLGGVLETPFAATAASDSAGSEREAFSLLDILAEAIERAKESQSEFENTFDGSRQSSVREFLESTGSDLGQVIRSGLQDNLAGVPREILSNLLESTGLEELSPVSDPILAIDFYGESSTVINGVLDSVSQPIGSLALPQLGPLLANPQNELFNTFA